MRTPDRKAGFTMSGAAGRVACFWAVWVLIPGISPTFGAESIVQANQAAAQTYQDYVKLEACIVAQNGVRAHLEGQARVSFDSCTSKKFDVAISADDRDYTVSGYATVLPPSGPPALKPFLVHIDHDAGGYPEWNFRVGRVEITP
jgi:hypothetical protein